MGTREFWFDGSAVVAGVAVHDLQDLITVLPTNARTWPIEKIAEWWSWNAKNPCALFVADSVEGWAACLPDPLGGALAFYHEQNAQILVSTQLKQIIQHMDNSGKVPNKSAQFQLERLIFGNGGLCPTSYDGVKGINPFEYIVVHKNSVRVREYSIFDEMRQASHYELFTILRDDVLSSTSAISKSNNRQNISHLTGGFDSRLVLSAILSQNIQNEFLFFCSGPEGSTDRIIADGLSRRFNLNRTTGAGLTTASTNVMSERLMGALFDSSGITNTGPQGREIHVPVSAMGGGYGEILRTFYGNRTISSDSTTVNWQLLRQEYIPSYNSSHPYIASHALKNIESSLISKFEELESRYDVAFLGDAFYTHVRNRYHIGQSSLLWSRVGSRFDPLYSVAGYCLAANSTQHVRTSNVTGFDLMESLKPDLLKLPFDYDRHNKELTSIRTAKQVDEWPESSKKLNIIESLVPDCSKTSPFLSVLDSLNVSEHQPTASERQALIKKANSMGANYWQVAYQTAGQDLLRKAYEQSRDSEIFEYIESKYVMELFTRKDLKRSELRDLYNLGGIITWLSFG